MAGLTAGKFYFIESESGQQDWITDNSGDPDNIVIGNFTEGTHFVALDIPRGFTVTGFTGIVVTPSGAGKSFDLRNAKRFYKALERGIQTSLANANLIDKFALSDRHVSGASATFKRYYLIIYFGTNLHLEFTDADDNRKSYCRGVINNVSRQWLDSDNLNFIVRINWDSVW